VSAAIPIAFYAPMKAPDHPVPSGDRRMGQLLMRALAQAGFAPDIASRLRTFDRAGDAARQLDAMRASEAEAGALLARCGDAPAAARPRLWFTYHVYYKAPDWIGPIVSRELGIPYAVAEGSRAGKRTSGPWHLANAAANRALDHAAAIFVLNELDRAALAAARPDGQILVPLPPFVDPGPDADAKARPGRVTSPIGPPRLLAVAMMRPGDKLASYRILAGALMRLADRPWRLAIVGDGEARAEIETLFRPLGGRVTFHGLIAGRQALDALYAEADLFVWPAVNEAYGMVFLEAQAQGCPVVAGRYGGVPGVVRDDETGLLAAPADAAAFAAAVAALLDDAPRRRTMGAAAGVFVRGGRTVAQAAAILGGTLRPLIARGSDR